MWHQKKKTFIRLKRQKELSDEMNPGKKLCVQPPKAPVILIDDVMLDCLKYVSWKCVNKCQHIDQNWFRVIKREKNLENGHSVLPPPLLEKIVMSKNNKSFHVPNREIHCAERCKSVVNLIPLPRTFQEFFFSQLLEIHVTNSGNIPDYTKDELVFSNKFQNKITDESWPHIQHWFKHLLEPYGILKSVSIVPFDMKIWNVLTESNPYLATKISAENLQIVFDFCSFSWVIYFCSEFCSANTLEWMLEGVNGKKHSQFDSDVDDSECDDDFTEKCLNRIREFVASQGHNFDKFEMNARWFCSIDQQNSLAAGIVQMFKSLNDPSKMIKQISLKQSLNCLNAKCHWGEIEKGFPFCLDETKLDIFKRSYKNQNSDYILETNSEYTLPGSSGKSRIIYLTVIKPTSQ